MAKKLTATRRGKVKKVIKSVHPGIAEKAEIVIEGADHLYKEIRIENTLEDGKGHKVKLKENADVSVVIEAEPKATIPKAD